MYIWTMYFLAIVKFINLYIIDCLSAPFTFNVYIRFFVIKHTHTHTHTHWFSTF